MPSSRTISANGIEIFLLEQGEGALVLARPWPEHLAGTQQIMLKYPSMDAADASLVSLTELSPKAALGTIDRRDFQLCRGLRNRALKLVLPE